MVGRNCILIFMLVFIFLPKLCSSQIISLWNNVYTKYFALAYPIDVVSTPLYLKIKYITKYTQRSTPTVLTWSWFIVVCCHWMLSMPFSHHFKDSRTISSLHRRCENNLMENNNMDKALVIKVWSYKHNITKQQQNVWIFLLYIRKRASWKHSNDIKSVFQCWSNATFSLPHTGPPFTNMV